MAGTGGGQMERRGASGSERDGEASTDRTDSLDGEGKSARLWSESTVPGNEASPLDSWAGRVEGVLEAGSEERWKDLECESNCYLMYLHCHGHAY